MTQPQSPDQTQAPYTDALNAALDEVDRVTGKRDDAAAALQAIPDDKDHQSERSRAQQSLQEFENQLTIAQRKVTDVVRQRDQVAARPQTGAGGAATKSVPQVKTDQGLYTKDDTANPGPDGSPGWRLAQDAQGNPIGAKPGGPGTAADTAAGKLAVSQQNADTAAQRASTQADVSQQNADTAAQRAATGASVGASSVDRNESVAIRNAALTPYQIADLQARGVLTAAQATALIDKTPAEIDQMEAKGDLSTAQAAQVRQKMTLAVAPQDVSAPSNQQFIAQRDPSTGQIAYIPNKNYIAADIGGRITQLQQQAAAKRDELNQRVASGQMTQDQATTEFNSYWDTSIAPTAAQLQQVQAQQAQDQAIKASAEQRAQQEQTRADYTTAQGAGQQAAQRAEAQMPYMVGPGFGAALNNIQGAYASGKAPGNIDLGSAVTFNMPDFNNIAEQATAQALAHLSPTAAGKLGQPMPTIPQMDVSGMLNKSTYAPTTTISPDGTVTIQHAPQQPDQQQTSPTPAPFAQSGMAEGSNGSVSLPAPGNPVDPSQFLGAGGDPWLNSVYTPPHFARGGIVTQPTLAVIGDAGPEAVVPLSDDTQPMYAPPAGAAQGQWVQSQDTPGKYVWAPDPAQPMYAPPAGAGTGRWVQSPDTPGQYVWQTGDQSQQMYAPPAGAGAGRWVQSSPGQYTWQPEDQTQPMYAPPAGSGPGHWAQSGSGQYVWVPDR